MNRTNKVSKQIEKITHSTIEDKKYGRCSFEIPYLLLIVLTVFSFVITHGIYGCRKNIKTEVTSINTNLPLEAKTAPVGKTALHKESDTTISQIIDTAKFLIEMWEDRFSSRDFERLLEALKTEKNPDYEEDLILELSSSYDTIVIQPLIERLQNDKLTTVRAAAAQALGNLALGNYGTFGEKHKPEFVRRKFGEDRFRELLSFKEKRIIPALKNALCDKDIIVVYSAASELIALGDTDRVTLKVLLNIFRKKNINKWKEQFISSKDISAEEQQKLKEKIERSKAELPERALEVLKKVKNKFVIDELTEALEDKDLWVRVKASQALEDFEE